MLVTVTTGAVSFTRPAVITPLPLSLMAAVYPTGILTSLTAYLAPAGRPSISAVWPFFRVMVPPLVMLPAAVPSME